MTLSPEKLSLQVHSKPPAVLKHDAKRRTVVVFTSTFIFVLEQIHVMLMQHVQILLACSIVLVTLDILEMVFLAMTSTNVHLKQTLVMPMPLVLILMAASLANAITAIPVTAFHALILTNV